MGGVIGQIQPEGTGAVPFAAVVNTAGATAHYGLDQVLIQLAYLRVISHDRLVRAGVLDDKQFIP